VAALYEQGQVHHVGHLGELEEQLLTWTGAPGERSPDRAEALVWALSDLMGYRQPASPELALAVRTTPAAFPAGRCPTARGDNPAVTGGRWSMAKAENR
jgi:hypothetical protein